MQGNVKQFKDALDEMKSIYPYDDEKTKMSNFNILTMSVADYLEIVTTDEKTGIEICMSKRIEDEL